MSPREVFGGLIMFDLDDKSVKVTRVKLDSDKFSHSFYVSNHFKLCLIMKGGGIWQIGNECISVREMDIVMLSNRQKRMFKEVSITDGIEMIVIEFGLQLCATHFQGLFFNSGEKYNCKISNMPEIVKLFKEIEQEERNQYYNYKLVRGAKIVQILTLIGRYYNITELDNKVSEDICQILEYINDNYTTDISISHAADVLHVSESNFSRYFTKYMGMGFTQYVMYKRIAYAIHLLQSSEKNVVEIAMTCGYNNTASFYKAFKKVTNMTPKEYRKSNLHML